MLISRTECLKVLRCPRTLMPLRWHGPDELIAATDDAQRQHRYRIVADLPILVDFDDSVLDEHAVLARSAESVIRRATYGGAAAGAKRLVSAPNPKSARNIRRFIDLLKQASAEPKVLVVGGGTIGDGAQPLYDDLAIKVYGFDIYGTPNVQFVADAHRIPLSDATFDGVVIQAVLEHALQPWIVAAEVSRVLRPHGLVYAETPFMQHVHEGAYDFTRFTESGHRYLFRDFDAVASGAIAGAGVQLLWSLDFFARSLFRSRAAGKLVKLGFFWLRYLDRVIPDPFAVDGASGSYFLGVKSNRKIGPKQIIAYYQGAQK